jgi:hypothetical protein
MNSPPESVQVAVTFHLKIKMIFFFYFLKIIFLYLHDKKY